MPLWARKDIPSTLASPGPAAHGAPALRRTLGFVDLCMIGIGCTIGAGIFVLTGTAAASFAGPAIVFSFLFAAVACLCAALCYAELASLIPVAGSAYTYAYTTLGELVAWIIGWSLALEYLMCASTIAVGWSGYFTSFLGECGMYLPAALTQPPLVHSGGEWSLAGGLINLPAVVMVLALTWVLSLGIRESSFFNNLMVAVKLAVILLVIGCGAAYINTAYWQPFVPPNTGVAGEFGWSGIMRGAGIVFFAYIGFDAVSTSAQEARNPRRDVPLALIATLVICTILYIAMSLVMTGMAPYTTLNVPDPVFVAVDHAGPALAWLKPIVSIGAIVGLASATLATLYGQTRIFYSMSVDGLIPPAFSKLHRRHATPAQGTWYTGLVAAAIAGCVPINVLGELVSIGTLFAFAIVCVGVLVLRRREPDLPRPFRTPFVTVVAVGGALSCAYLMYSLPRDTWVRLAVWLAIGMAVYIGYGHRHSKLRESTRAAPVKAGALTPVDG
jgi:APA family basic amino acid/polyamine antiporter